MTSREACDRTVSVISATDSYKRVMGTVQAAVNKGHYRALIEGPVIDDLRLTLNLQGYHLTPDREGLTIWWYKA